MDRLVDLIKVYDHDLDDGICDYLIHHFEKNPTRHKKVSRNKTPNFTEYNLTRHSKKDDKTKKIYDHLVSKLHRSARSYFDFTNKKVKHMYPDDHYYANTLFPNHYGIERFRIKRYHTGKNEGFNTHCDVMNLLSCSRFLSFLWYLNDVDEGGETIFNNKVVTPQKGRLVIFPPMWIFPHMGVEPISNTKYIMSSYLRYNKILNRGATLKNLWEIII